MAAMSFFAASVSPRCSSIIAAVQKVASCATSAKISSHITMTKRCAFDLVKGVRCLRGRFAESDYDAVLDVSLRGTLLMSQAVIPAMHRQKSGSIIGTSSVSARTAFA